MVFRMIVPEVLVHVQRRHRGGRYHQGLHKHQSDEAAHEDSLPEAAPASHESGGVGLITPFITPKRG